MPRISKQQTYVGEEQGGKSFLAGRYAEAYAQKKGIVLVYNVGRATDYPDSEYYLVEPLSFAEHIKYFHSEKNAKASYKLDPQITHFRCGKQIYHMRSFSRMFLNTEKRKVKMFYIENRKEETAFFFAIYKYISQCLVIFDDCRSTFRYGLNAGHIRLMSRKNHTGQDSDTPALRGRGVDIITMFHNCDGVNSEIWDYTTNLILLREKNPPTLKDIRDDAAKEEIQRCAKALKIMPKYTALDIPFTGEEYLKTKNVTYKLK